MAAVILDGREISAQIQADLKDEVTNLQSQGVNPCLAVLLVGDNPASHTYVRSKLRVAQSLGIASRDHILAGDTPEEEVLALIRRLNDDPAVHGILVQLPLPESINTARVLGAVAPEKDVDGFHPMNLGRLMMGPTPMPPCTPAGIMEILRRAGVELKGKEAVVVGRSNIVGKPVAFLLLHEHATVTICHSRTRDLPAVCRRAEVLVVAIGRARMVTDEYVRPGAVVIDVGINRENGRLVGDVDFETVRHVAGAITPVPGGVGPMTITMLMKSTLTAAALQSGLKSA
ncbi:MAG: bifunctional methylenetetrahydrofolate dehydrogenase/methenyltetrahydrofolate cyclohydrolase FolD [Armatimonadetes bacterium]|nr:bifunctional methylenetetrahydrofolate dehydrogenase/methenyltetrahydrofolate cyclohydrolase FolD [Armatimonadota bacterium]